MRGILIFVLCIAAVGAALGVAAAGAKNKRVNIFKTQAGAWLVTIIMVTAAIGIGYAKAPANNPAPEPELPNAPASGQSYVRDGANVLSSQTMRVLDQRNQRLDQRHSAVVGVVTCNYGRDDLYQYTVKQFESMGLGDNDMIVVLDISGENYWLYTGNAVAWQFSDEDCSEYAYDYMEDYFARGMYDDAVLDLTEALEEWYEDYYD